MLTHCTAMLHAKVSSACMHVIALVSTGIGVQVQRSSTARCSAAQYCTVQVQCRYTAVHCSAVQCSCRLWRDLAWFSKNRDLCDLCRSGTSFKFANSEEAMFDRLATVPLNENYSVEPQQIVAVFWRCCAIEALQKIHCRKFTAWNQGS